jgi:phage terminase Nu1 subunit (DNA packaging protein)
MAQRTIASKLADIPTDGVDERGHAGWRLLTVLPILGFQRNGQGTGNSDYEASRAEWMRIRAERAALELAKERGELIAVTPHLQEVQQVWARIFYEVRARFLGIPSRLAAQHSRLTTPRAVFDISTGMIRSALNQLASNTERATKLPGLKAGQQSEEEEEKEDVDA